VVAGGNGGAIGHALRTVGSLEVYDNEGRKVTTYKVTRVRVALLAIAMAIAASLEAQEPVRQPLDVAKLLASRYPEAPIMSYIPGIAWSSALRLAQLTGDASWKEKPRRDMQPFIAGEKPAIAPPYLLTSLAGHAAFSDLAALDGNAAAGALAKKAADFILGDSPDEIVRFPRKWTDDMFMATTLLARVAARERDERYAQAVGRLLRSYAGKLQRPDGLFIHALDGPHAWGRGNGFALLGLAEALAYMPPDWSEREAMLEIYRKQINALAERQSDDGAWRQVVDEPDSYRELTVTAMTVAGMARGVRLGWLKRDFMPAIERGWKAVLVRVNADGTLRDVCAGTGAGETKEYYLKRPVVNGADDRGGAMVLLAAVEMEELVRVAP
jgi:rhamnogalacturonyl hydrolase YesR